MDIFDSISPLDFRYYGRDKAVHEKLSPFLSENAMIKYMLKVEAALTNTLADRKVCTRKIAGEVEKAAEKVTAEEVYAEEDRIKHNIRALANMIRKRVSREARPFVHFTTTSHDIISTAEAMRYKEAAEKAAIPELLSLEKTLMGIALREKATLQIGRTHGQHAEPITFGFAIASYVSRLGTRIAALKSAAANLRGKISGAVGAYNASSLFFRDAEDFERDVLKKLGLRPATHSTQIVEPEYLADYVHAIVSAMGVMANLADDMRHLQRSEIAEVGEAFGAEQVGSSTMPHKRNPISFENVKSMWKAFMPRMATIYADQISEHQRDLTNSASSRFVPEIVAGLVIMAGRLNRAMAKLVVDRESLQRNFAKSKEMIIAEPLYILLAAHNHPDAHEHVRKLTLESQQKNVPLKELVFSDKTLEPYLKKFTKEQLEILRNPELYRGIAEKKVERVCKHWGIELEI
jgi:adenylosuccinate lyase